jgi:mycothiol system anti-sigma-R factor
MIDCKETLARIYEYLDGELTPEKAKEVADHLDFCRGCFDRAEFERVLGELVRRAGKAGAHAEPLQQKIAAKLKELSVATGDGEELFPNQVESEHMSAAPRPTVSDSELARLSSIYIARGVDVHRKPTPSTLKVDRHMRDVPIWSYMLVAAAIVLIAIPIFRQYIPSSGIDPMVTAFVAMHSEDRPEVTTDDPEMLSDWIKRRTSFDPMVQKFVMAGCAVKGAAVDSVWQTQLSHLYAEHHGKPVSVFVTAMNKFKMPAKMDIVQMDDQVFWTARDGNYTVVIWKQHPAGVVCVAVAEMDVMDVVKLAYDADKFMRAPA